MLLSSSSGTTMLLPALTLAESELKLFELKLPAKFPASEFSASELSESKLSRLKLPESGFEQQTVKP